MTNKLNSLPDSAVDGAVAKLRANAQAYEELNIQLQTTRIYDVEALLTLDPEHFQNPSVQDGLRKNIAACLGKMGIDKPTDFESWSLDDINSLLKNRAVAIRTRLEELTRENIQILVNE